MALWSEVPSFQLNRRDPFYRSHTNTQRPTSVTAVGGFQPRGRNEGDEGAFSLPAIKRSQDKLQSRLAWIPVLLLPSNGHILMIIKHIVHSHIKHVPHDAKSYVEHAILLVRVECVFNVT